MNSRNTENVGKKDAKVTIVLENDPASKNLKHDSSSAISIEKDESDIEIADSHHVTRLPSRVYTITYPNQFLRRESTRRVSCPNVTKKIRRRVVFKNGDCNVVHSKISQRHLRFIRDIFTTLVDSQWRWTLLMCVTLFMGSWSLFGLMWWLIAYTHGDLEPDHLPQYQKQSNWTPCVTETYGLTSSFLFSVETQHTTGYGARSPSEECPEAIFLMCVQNIAGLIIEVFTMGIVFAKLTRPKLRAQTLKFSKRAVISLRDGCLCLMFRVGDMRKSHIIETSIRAQLVCDIKTKEGDILHNYQTELEISADSCGKRLFLVWPFTVVHKIDESSPLYYLSANDLINERFEIICVLEGTIESTDQRTQARTSYLSNEILWGHKFEPVVSYDPERQEYEVDYSKFDMTLLVDTPLCSSRELFEYYKLKNTSGINQQGTNCSTYL